MGCGASTDSAAKTQPGPVAVQPAPPPAEARAEPEAPISAEEELRRQFSKPVNPVRAQKVAAGEVAPTMTDADDGQEMSPTRRSLGAIFAPSRYEGQTLPGSLPDRTLALQFVHGYRGRDCRDNAFFLNAQEIVYHIAAVGIVYNMQSHTQRFFLNHDDDILCLDVHPSKRFVVTGQLGPKAQIMVWDVQTMQLRAEFKGVHTHGIRSVAFSPCGRYIAACGIDDNHIVTCYEWENAAAPLRGKDSGERNKLLSICWSPDSQKFAAVGTNAVRFFTLAAPGLGAKKGMFGDKINFQTMTCAKYLPDGNVLAGTNSGELFVWKDCALQAKVSAVPSGRVTAIFPHPSGAYVVATSNCQLSLWRYAGSLQRVGQPAGLAISGEPRSVAVLNDRVLVGTSENCLHNFRYDATAGAVADGTMITQTHFEELWGLTMHPTQPLCFTSGDDAVVHVWNYAENRKKHSIRLSAKSRVCCVSPNGEFLACGTEEGSVEIFRLPDYTPVTQIRHRTRQISEIKFTPDSMRMAVGCHESVIDLYNVANWQRTGTLTGHSSFITHFDFSRDGRFLQSNCGAYEILFWDVATAAQITAAHQLRDTEWASWSCVIGWPVLGIWPKFSDGTDINAVDVNEERNLIVMGDDFRHVELARFPCVDKMSEKRIFNGHSEHVTNVRFMRTQQGVVSTGGLDCGVFVWRLQ